MTYKNSRSIKHWPLSILAACSLVTGVAQAANFNTTKFAVSPAPNPSGAAIGDLLAASSASYNAECAEKIGQTNSHRHYSGNLAIDTPTEVELYRCLESVSGDLTIDSPTSKGITLPWLRTVGGDLELIGNHHMADARLPRLYDVGNRVIVDAWSGGATRWEANALTNHDGRFFVESGTTTDLRGFSNLEDIGTLQIDLRRVSSPGNQQYPRFKGLAGLVSVGKLDLDTSAGEASEDGDFLSNLIEVRGDALVRADHRLVGMGAIETIGDDLNVELTAPIGSARADGLDSLVEVGGHFEWSGLELTNLDALANLEYVGGDLLLPLYVSSLEGLSGLEEVGGDFALEGAVNVDNLGALAALHRVNGRLSIENSPIESLSGLEGVQSLGGLTIRGNFALGNVSALDGATVAGNSSVIITNNSPLTNCQANSLISAMNVPGTTSKTTTGNEACFAFQRIKVFRAF